MSRNGGLLTLNSLISTGYTSLSIPWEELHFKISKGFQVNYPFSGFFPLFFLFTTKFICGLRNIFSDSRTPSAGPPVNLAKITYNYCYFNYSFQASQQNCPWFSMCFCCCATLYHYAVVHNNKKMSFNIISCQVMLKYFIFDPGLLNLYVTHLIVQGNSRQLIMQ